MFSVIIPAYNEASVIDRCLSAMLADARPGELEIVVVANNCSDDTAARARRHGELVKVVETPIGSKIHALNLGDRRYEATVELEVSGDGHGGLALFYDERGHAGLGFSRSQMLTYGYGQEQRWMREDRPAGPVHIRLVNRDNVLTFFHSPDGLAWRQHPWQMEVSGLHHNVFGGFVSLRVALFSAGAGEVRLRRFTYRGLD